jgi:Fibrobacter succinogenes major domain (Fib_succ_major).
MKNKAILILTALAFILPSGCLKKLEKEGIFSDTLVFGTVTVNDADHTPASNVVVSLVDGENMVRSTTTDARGYYEISVSAEEIHKGFAFKLTADSVYQDAVFSLEEVGFGLERYELNMSLDGPSLPQVQTLEVSNVTTQSALAKGVVTNNGNLPLQSRGFCWSRLPNPTVNDAHVNVPGGVGEFTATLTGLEPAITYYVRAYASNSQGLVYGAELSFTTEGVFHCGNSKVYDFDGNPYNTLLIGTQCWTRESMRTTHYSDGTAIPAGTTSGDTPYRYAPGNDESNVSTYGYLYNWSATMRGAASGQSPVQGVCPDGWHVPTDAEWTQLTNTVSSSGFVCGGNPDNNAKALAATWGWNSSNVSCSVGEDPSSNNVTTFTALPAGFYSGTYSNMGGYVYFWTSTESGSSTSYSRLIRYDNPNVAVRSNGRKNGNLVRCVLD